MDRHRKVAIAHGEEDKENCPMYACLSKAQLNDSCHKKQLHELKNLYQQMGHAAFSSMFMKMIKASMEAEEENECADTALNFCAKFVSAFNGDRTSPLFKDILDWLLSTTSQDAHIRYRLCEFVNKILNALDPKVYLDDKLCADILAYMMDRLSDTSSKVRVQAIKALQRLQVRDDPQDSVLKAYQFHLATDPSPRVRVAVITCMVRNQHTIPCILQRLWDIDEKVRRHTYLEMSSYPVRSYKVAQRLTLLEQGLNDRSNAVRKVVITVLLHQWLESYRNDMTALVAALKLDSNEEDIRRFRKIAKLTLLKIFKCKDRIELVAALPMPDVGEYHHCVPHNSLTIEAALLWQCLSQFFQNESFEELDSVQPELSTFCSYVEQFCLRTESNIDQFKQMAFQYTLLSLMEILFMYDLGDEIGRQNLQKLLTNLLNKYNLDEQVIGIIVRCTENLISNDNERMQYFVDIIRDLCDLNPKNKLPLHDRTLVDELLAKAENPDLNIKVSTLRVKILELQEQQEDHEKQENYELAQRVADAREAAKNEYITLLSPLMEQCDDTGESVENTLIKVIEPETILKCLQIAYHMVVSKKVTSLNPNLCQLYKDFICRHFASNQSVIRNWALKCGTAYSLKYQPLAKGVFVELNGQFMRISNTTVWETIITCTFELLARYGLNVLVSENFDTLAIMSQFLDKCDKVALKRAIVKGFCRLILYGYVKSTDIVGRLILRYFDESTDAEMNQMLGIFLDNLIKRKKFDLLQLSLLPTIHKILNSSSGNPLRKINLKTITGFFIEAMRGEPCPKSGTMHNGLALMFLTELSEASNNKELCKLLVSELRTLDISLDNNQQLSMELKTLTGQLQQVRKYDQKVMDGLKDFIARIEGRRFAGEAEHSNTNYSEDENDENSFMADSSTSMSSLTTDISSTSNTPTSYGRDNLTRSNNLDKSHNLVRDRPDSTYGREKVRPNKSPAISFIKSTKCTLTESKATRKRNSQEISPKGIQTALALRNTPNNVEHEQSFSTGDAVTPPTKKTRSTLFQTP